MNKVSISVIIPFYHGNDYMYRLLDSIEKVSQKTTDCADYEVIIVNDSPEDIIRIPDDCSLNVNIISNEKNEGIQTARKNGLMKSHGDWILFLDQDDELIDRGFRRQIELTQTADVVVGNGVYNLGSVSKGIYTNEDEMKYLIQQRRFINIRNLIPSPGECLIKKGIIPEIWKTQKLKNNGADDWLLWLLLFSDGAIFACNGLPVYIHNDAGGNNLSADLSKMRISAKEMISILKMNRKLSDEDSKRLSAAIDFKFKQDTKQLRWKDFIIFFKPIMNNVIYKCIRNYYALTNDSTGSYKIETDKTK